MSSSGYEVTRPQTALATLGLEWARGVKAWGKFVVKSRVLT
jgi:hypothetical protein